MTRDIIAEATAWAEYAMQLAQWTWERLVNRDDVWGSYLPLRQREENLKLVTAPPKDRRGIDRLSLDVLTQHFRGVDHGDVVGLHTTSPGGTSRWGCFDIDAHDEARDYGAPNKAYARLICARLRQDGLHPIVEDGDGRGGLHIWIIFSSPVATARLFAYLTTVLADITPPDGADMAETFPKQAAPESGKYGNWVRLPGRHHTLAHWSRIAAPGKWLTGKAAVDALLNAPLSPSTALPIVQATVVPPPAAIVARSMVVSDLSPRISAYLAALPVVTKGGRNRAAIKVAAWLRRDMAMEENDARPWLREWNHSHCTPSLGDAELEQILSNGYAHGKHQIGSGLNRDSWVPRQPIPYVATASSPTAISRSAQDAPNHRAAAVQLGAIWPAPMARAAFHGVAGEAVRILLPFTESDPAALIVQFLAFAGAVFGRGSYYEVEGDRHHPNLFVLVVGDTSTGGKGTGLGRIRRIFDLAAGLFMRTQVISGLSSGEGLINRVRDILAESEKGQPSPSTASTTSVAPDPTKRILVIESEFAGVLEARGRDGNTLSAVLRVAWDGLALHVTTRKDPLVAHDAHISIIGQITREELTDRLRSNDLVNGFANRFLFCASRRSKYLAEPEQPPFEDMLELVGKVRAALDWSHALGAVKFDDDAKARWKEVHPRLVQGLPGRLAKPTSRARPQVARLALVYALLDQSTQIRREHLDAALAVWDYCEASAAYTFGNPADNPRLVKFVTALQENPAHELDRTQLRDLFDRHLSRAELTELVKLAVTYGMVDVRVEPTGGRPREVFSLATNATLATKPDDEDDDTNSPEPLLSLRSLSSPYGSGSRNGASAEGAEIEVVFEDGADA